MNHLLALPKYPPKATMSSSNMADDENRPTADFHPSPWGDFFATHNFASDHVLKEWKEGIEVLKPYVVRMLSATAGEDAERLKLVDVVERLGIGYLFEGEMQQILQQVYETHDSTDDLNNDNMNLHDVALRFRLLREHGYDVSSDIFNEFKTEKGEFKEELASDVEGILSLYEASYLRKQGESVLDEAIHFTKSHLEAKVVDVESLLSERLAHALERPLRKGMEILEHLFFISIYERMSGHHATLLRLAKLSFNVLQYMYQGELRALTEYWIDLDFARRLHYGRDKLVEAYIWGVGSLWEPKFALARTSITKIAALGTFLDDTTAIERCIFTLSCDS
ncbi:unnamed protein product [Linum tenue]|uniref:Uncharacterized protein n=1 Tax=Linum tenue TaxID=586396 RepID=A0AAV0P497_9ROSI|nr:unnamed protein product [Linum tenue]